MNAHALHITTPVSAGLQAAPKTQGAVENQIEDKSFAQTLTKQTETQSPGKSAAELTADTSVKHKNHKTHTSKALADEQSPEDENTLVWSTLFIADESQSIRQTLAKTKTEGDAVSIDKNAVSLKTKPTTKASINVSNEAYSESTIQDKPSLQLESELSTRVQALTAPMLSFGNPHQQGLTQQNSTLSKAINNTQKTSTKLAQDTNHKLATLHAQYDANNTADPNAETINNASKHTTNEFALSNALTNASTELNLNASFIANSTNTTNLSPSTLQATLGLPLHHSQWGQEFGRQVLSFSQGAHNGIHQAELRLDPPELGPIRISLNLSDNVAQAYIVSPHANVRSAIEQALPQLQQAFAQAGLSLGQADVGDQSMSQQFQNEANHNAKQKQQDSFANLFDSPTNGIDIDNNLKLRTVNPNALVDTFA